MGHAGAGNQKTRRAQPGQGIIDGIVCLGLVGDVGGYRMHHLIIPDAKPFQRLPYLIESRQGARDQGKIPTEPYQPFGNGEADTAGTAGDDGVTRVILLHDAVFSPG